MATRPLLSDAEFVARTRAGNRRRAERQRERLANEGKTALTVWLPNTIRLALIEQAAARNATIAETATALLSVALATAPLVSDHIASEPPPAVPDTLPLFDPVSIEREHECPSSVEPLDSFNADPNSIVNGGAVRSNLTLDMTPRFELDAHATRERPKPVETVLSRDAMLAEVAALLNDKPALEGAEIARRLTAQGFKASNGAPLKGANLLRDYRRWCKKHGLNANSELKR